MTRRVGDIIAIVQADLLRLMNNNVGRMFTYLNKNCRFFVCAVFRGGIEYVHSEQL